MASRCKALQGLATTCNDLQVVALRAAKSLVSPLKYSKPAAPPSNQHAGTAQKGPKCPSHGQPDTTPPDTAYGHNSRTLENTPTGRRTQPDTANTGHDLNKTSFFQEFVNRRTRMRGHWPWWPVHNGCDGLYTVAVVACTPRPRLLLHRPPPCEQGCEQPNTANSPTQRTPDTANTGHCEQPFTASKGH